MHQLRAAQAVCTALISLQQSRGFKGLGKGSDAQDISYLVQEGLKDIPGLGHSNHAGCAGIVDPVMEVIHSTRIHDLFSANVRAGQLPDACAELRHRSVVLCAAKEAHMCVGQALRHRQALAIWPNKGTCKLHEPQAAPWRTQNRDGVAQNSAMALWY